MKEMTFTGDELQTWVNLAMNGMVRALFEGNVNFSADIADMILASDFFDEFKNCVGMKLFSLMAKSPAKLLETQGETEEHIEIRVDETALRYMTDEECRQFREYADQLAEKVKERESKENTSAK